MIEWKFETPDWKNTEYYKNLEGKTHFWAWQFIRRQEAYQFIWAKKYSVIKEVCGNKMLSKKDADALSISIRKNHQYPDSMFVDNPELRDWLSSKDIWAFHIYNPNLINTKSPILLNGKRILGVVPNSLLHHYAKKPEEMEKLGHGFFIFNENISIKEQQKQSANEIKARRETKGESQKTDSRMLKDPEKLAKYLQVLDSENDPMPQHQRYSLIFNNKCSLDDSDQKNDFRNYADKIYSTTLKTAIQYRDSKYNMLNIGE